MYRLTARMLVAAVLGISLASSAVYAQNEGVEPQARGAVHEAFANPVDGSPAASRIIEQAPPEAIEEVPPDQKPEGDNVIWVPGYWAWDDARNDFLWISGFWRVPPPGRTWVPGSWRRANGGHQWVAGYWADADQPEQEYLPPPPASLEAGPSIPAPTADHVYVPGTWVYSTSRFVWRPGAWHVYRPNWVWVPAHYRWTPVGYVFIDGYWDFVLRDRGLLFSPVYIDRRVCYRPRWFYTPSVVVFDDALYGAMFVRPGCSHYYFGDYFDARFSRLGFRSWFSVSFSVGFTYDPLFSYYSFHYRRDPFWAPAIRDVYRARYANDIPRPHVTVVNNVVNNNVNIINNPVVINKYTNITKTTNITNITNVNNTVVNIKQINNTNVNNTNINKVKLQTVSAAQKEQFVKTSKDIQNVGKQKIQVENQLAKQGGPTGKNDAPKTVKLDLPKPPVTANTTTGTNNPPPPVVINKPKPNPKPVDPKTTTTPGVVGKPIDPKPPVKPMVDPPVKPPVKPIDPKPPVKPMVDPPVKPMVDPPVKPPVKPMVDPPVKPPVKPMVDPPVKPPVKPPVTDPPKKPGDKPKKP